ncbi:bromo adjacent homology domain-containing 1 protein isoform X1 [Hypomesus transpacificus]|uniref:bromo adjacent homology domain-containing 1 protein isoform X1 n=1 Tax=Hypomesus transpacificus TaxID=137520 RepID=UPI001F071B98|nr:bromo adjacent homology domain-containing 1 protein isoform X1 [Hypomesus transpacificus]XP_046874321.1 bromo adjacent homology domain-containing 1 protein isoform X1 [Hypomesus transpacificus]
MGGANPDMPAKRGRPPKVKRGRRKGSKDMRMQEVESIKEPGLSEGETLGCRVLLTRLEEKRAVGGKDGGRRGGRKKVQNKPSKSVLKTFTVSQNAPEPKKSNQSNALCSTLPPLELRKRRLASLNAEAVNSLLLHRQDSSGPTLTKKRIERQDSRNNPKTKKPHSGSLQKHKRAKMEEVGFDLASLTTPTPRRQAGLMATALLRLSSTPRGGRCRSVKRRCEKQVHSKLEKQQVRHQPLPRMMLVQRCCGLCDRECSQEGAQRTGPPEGQGGLPHGPQCSSLRPVKKEQAEMDVTPTSCCPSSQGRCKELCHCLALLMDHRSYQEPEEHCLTKGYHLHLHSPHALAYPALTIGPHPHPHSHLHPCFSGYYIHLTHHNPSSPPHSTNPLPYPPSTTPSITLCPEGVHSQRLLPQTDPEPWLQPQASGIPHPSYCPSVGVCYREACRTGGYTYTAVPAIPSSGCSQHASCPSCCHHIKIEDFSSSSLEVCSARACSAHRPLSGCPMPTVPPAAQSVPHLKTPLSDPNQPQAPLRVGRECPQSAKAPSGSRSAVRGGVSPTCCPEVRDKHRSRPAAASGHARQARDRPGQVKQSRAGRQRQTNGWLPLGEPFQKEVFTVGEEAAIIRKCFEGVQRDGEVIRVRDTVLLRSGPRNKSLPYVAKISALWEEPESGEMMMSLFWYYRPEHTQGGHNPSMHCENEIFASRHQDVNSVACIEDKCYVLTLAQYCRFRALVASREEGHLGNTSLVPPPSFNHTLPDPRPLPPDVNPNLVFVCRHVYDFRYGRILKNLQ